MDTMKKRIVKPRWETIAVLVLPALLSLGMGFVYIATQMVGLYAGDSGGLVAASYRFGISHPPGYPLYTFLSAILSNMLPFGTIAWRVGLMSSIPMAMSLYFLWKSAWQLTKNLIWSSIGVILYGTLFPVWLHAADQEVFGLFSLFSAVLLYLSLMWFEEKKVWQLYALSFFFGLAFTHHHLIVLPLFSFLVIVYQYRNQYIGQIRKNWLYCALLFFLGLIPYIYAPIVSLSHTIIEPGNASTISGFFQLVTRASYGTFRAASNLSVSLIDRLLNIYTLLQFSLRDFTLIGWMGVAIGVFSLRKTKEREYIFLIVNFFLWLFYYFYAGFPLLLNYHMGTAERFVIVPYQLLAILFIVGGTRVDRFIQSKFIGNGFIKSVGTIALPAIIVGWFAYSAFSYIPALRYLHQNHSMEQLGADLDASIPEHSIVFLYADTTAYAFDYYYYVLGKRQDVLLIRLESLVNQAYRERIGRQYPELVLPSFDETKAPGFYIADFFSKNLQKYTIVTDAPQEWLSGVWVPNGLLYIYAPDQAYVAPVSIIEEKYTQLWNQFTPDSGLRKYQKQLLLLSDILRVYAQRRLAFALYVVEHNGSGAVLTDAFTKALSEEISVIPEAYVNVIYTLLAKKNCTLSQQFLKQVYEKWGSDYTVLSGYHRFVDVCGTTDETILARDAMYHKRNPSDALLSQ